MTVVARDYMEEVSEMKIFVLIIAILLAVTSCAEWNPATYVHAVKDYINCAKDTPVTSTEHPNLMFNKYDTFTGGEITVNNSDYVIPAEYSELIAEHIGANTQTAGFYAIDLSTQMSFGYNATADFFSASTVKVGYALYCFSEIAKGNASFTDRITYKRSHYIGGSGSTQHSVYGTIFTVKVLLYRMLYDSDNIAFYMLIDMFGLDGYNEMTADLGCTNKITLNNKWGHLTPHELGLIWQEIYYFKDTCEEGEIFWTYLTGNLFNDIKAALPKYSEVAHKSGWNDDACHDSGVIVSETPYIIVVMSGNKSSHAYISKIIRYIDDIMTDYNQSSKK